MTRVITDGKNYKTTDVVCVDLAMQRERSITFCLLSTLGDQSMN